jgi:hypothetical protein
VPFTVVRRERSSPARVPPALTPPRRHRRAARACAGTCVSLCASLSLCLLSSPARVPPALTPPRRHRRAARACAGTCVSLCASLSLCLLSSPARVPPALTPPRRHRRAARACAGTGHGRARRSQHHSAPAKQKNGNERREANHMHLIPRFMSSPPPGQQSACNHGLVLGRHPSHTEVRGERIGFSSP